MDDDFVIVDLPKADNKNEYEQKVDTTKNNKNKEIITFRGETITYQFKYSNINKVVSH